VTYATPVGPSRAPGPLAGAQSPPSESARARHAGTIRVRLGVTSCSGASLNLNFPSHDSNRQCYRWPAGPDIPVLRLGGQLDCPTRRREATTVPAACKNEVILNFHLTEKKIPNPCLLGSELYNWSDTASSERQNLVFRTFSEKSHFLKLFETF
jgi:hypothetical protein